jgi:hypothetical protein
MLYGNSQDAPLLMNGLRKCSIYDGEIAASSTKTAGKTG